MADAGPIPKAVLQVITETAEIRVTPSLSKIGNAEAMSRSPNPAAEGIHTNSICPIGIRQTAVNCGCFFNSFKGFIAKCTSASEAPIDFI